LEKVTDTSVKPVLFLVFAMSITVNTLSINAASFFEDRYINLIQLEEIRDHLGELLVQLSPDIIALTVAWDFTDASLASANGCKDGNLYERLMEWTRQLPINQNAKAQGGLLENQWETHIRPMLRARM
jgi:acyl-CoA oxidase